MSFYDTVRNFISFKLLSLDDNNCLLNLKKENTTLQTGIPDRTRRFLTNDRSSEFSCNFVLAEIETVRGE